MSFKKEEEKEKKKNPLKLFSKKGIYFYPVWDDPKDEILWKQLRSGMLQNVLLL